MMKCCIYQHQNVINVIKLNQKDHLTVIIVLNVYKEEIIIVYGLINV